MIGVKVDILFGEAFDMETARGTYYFSFGERLCNERQNYTLDSASYVVYMSKTHLHFILAKQTAGTYSATNEAFGKDPGLTIEKFVCKVKSIRTSPFTGSRAYSTSDGKFWTKVDA